jgi:hypothetical protein
MLSSFLARFTRLTSKRRLRLTQAETENTFIAGQRWLDDQRERPEPDREEVLRAALLAWRTHPLARRIIELTTAYVVGGGLELRCADPAALEFLRAWWQHPLNQIDQHAAEWCDELSRAGELFFLLSTGPDGMSYLRPLPAAQVCAVSTQPNDVMQETACTQRLESGETRDWPIYDPLQDAPGPDGSFETVALHFAINRPAAAVRGESDLAPILRWLKMYSGWLEDRARLNRYRYAFLYVVKAAFSSESERLARQQALSALPPTSGSILVTDTSESWEVIEPKLESSDANQDGLAIKRLIAAGAGIPLHFLAEPEGATRTTAEAAGGPAYRRFEQRQQYFCWMLAELARAALRRRAAWGEVRAEASLSVQGADLSARDNAAVAGAAAAVSGALAPLWDRGLIREEEVRRLVYRFLGEVEEGSE